MTQQPVVAHAVMRIIIFVRELQVSVLRGEIAAVVVAEYLASRDEAHAVVSVTSRLPEVISLRNPTEHKVVCV